jgi:regulator of protease activity HflC (stomatin/prohibitin superfamily)
MKRIFASVWQWTTHHIRRINDAGIGWLKRNLPYLLVGTFVILFLVAYLFNHIVVSIMPGEAAVLYRRFFGGTDLTHVYGEGVHLIWPWDIMYPYNIRVQQIPHQSEVLTKDGLKVTIDTSIICYPDYGLLGMLHQHVGPDYINTIVIPEIEAIIRTNLGKMSAEEIYMASTPILESTVNKAVEKISERFVRIDDVLIKKIVLPEFVKQAIENKMQEKHLALAYEFKLQRERQEAERKRVEAMGIKTYNELINSSLTAEMLKWKGIIATESIAQSPNAKVVVIGNGENGLPVILGADK